MLSALGTAGALASAGCAHYPLDPAPPGALAAAVASLHIPGDARVLAGAGDIARCEAPAAAAATGRLLDAIVAAAPDAAIFTAGDHAYPRGTPEQFERCYDPAWGRFNARTFPTPGNHDYETPDAEGFYGYFELFDRRPPARGTGYYAFEIGTWLVLALNSIVALAPESAQIEWLERTLAQGPAHDCIAAIWHNPLFSSGLHGWVPWDNGRDTALFWKAMAPYGVDIVVNGHDHLYERFAPQDAEGRAVPGGIRAFVVGTGGAGLHRIVRHRANSEFVDNQTFGVLVLMLRPSSYEWAFIGVDGVVHDRSAAPVPCA